MGRPGVGQRGRRRAEAAVLVDPVEVQDAVLTSRDRRAVGGPGRQGGAADRGRRRGFRPVGRPARIRLRQAHPHRHPHPEQLRRLDPARPPAGLVDRQVALEQGLDAQEVAVQVGGRVELGREAVEVVVQERRADPSDGDAMLQRGREGLRVGRLQALDALAVDLPVERLLVDVGQEDPGGEAREVGVTLDQRLRVQDHQAPQIRPRDPGRHRTAKLDVELTVVEVEVEAYGGETDALGEVVAVPERRRAVGFDDRDRRELAGARRGVRGLAAGAEDRPLGAVDDVALGGAHLAGEDELLLDDVLDRLDRHVDQSEAGGALADPAGDRGGGRRVGVEGEERQADGVLDLRGVPRHDVAGATDQAQAGEATADAGGGGRGPGRADRSRGPPRRDPRLRRRDPVGRSSPGGPGRGPSSCGSWRGRPGPAGRAGPRRCRSWGGPRPGAPAARLSSRSRRISSKSMCTDGS